MKNVLPNCYKLLRNYIYMLVNNGIVCNDLLY